MSTENNTSIKNIAIVHAIFDALDGGSVEAFKKLFSQGATIGHNFDKCDQLIIEDPATVFKATTAKRKTACCGVFSSVRPENRTHTIIVDTLKVCA